MEVVAIAASWMLENINPQKILQTVGIASFLGAQSTIVQDLTPALSSNASVIPLGSPGFAEATSRWSSYYPPLFDTVVNVMTEQDVSETVRYANQVDKPFIARSGGHGSNTSLKDFQGIQIDMRGLQKVEISHDGTTATIGGGALSKRVIQELWKHQKQAVTGICECTSIVGPLLGGGHGLLQGQYGLLADQMLEARVVLANGTAVIASEQSHPDLFWALKGAGHNFGIVTELKYKIYDVPDDGQWAYEIFWFTHDKFEQLYGLTNKMMVNQPPHMDQWTFAYTVPEIDPHHLVFMYMIVWQGSSADAQAYAAPIQQLGAARSAAGRIPYPELPALMDQGEGGPACIRGLSWQRFPFHTNTYHNPTLRKALDEFDRMVHERPGLNNSRLLLEGYSTHGVKRVPPESTAFAHRSDEIIMVLYAVGPGDDESDAVAVDYGKRMRSHILTGTDKPDELRAYVNYAYGDEKPEDMYGWEPWRMEKLRTLKMEYDPENKFRWYAPIVKP